MILGRDHLSIMNHHMGDTEFGKVPTDISKLDAVELSNRVAHTQKRIEQGVASDEDYVEFIMCQLELADRGIISS